MIGEGSSPPSQVETGVLVGDSVVGTEVVGAAFVGLTVVGWEAGVSVAGFAVGAFVGIAVGLDGIATTPLIVSLKNPLTTFPFFIS